MKRFFNNISSSTSTNPSRKAVRNLWSRLVEPVVTITEESDIRQARLVSAMLLITSIFMISGIVYMGFFSTSPRSGYVLAGADIIMAIAYFLSRSRYYRLAIILSLADLTIIPVLNVGLGTDHSSETLLVMLIWNTLTILLASAITSLRNTLYFVIINFITLLLLPIFIPTVTFPNMAIPIIFNIVISSIILLFSHHRNLMENVRLMEVSKANEQLQVELSERKRIEEKLAYTSLHDPLTNLPNRVLFLNRLSHAMDLAKRNKNYTFAVFFIDIDRFKVVNDSLGHNVGDLLLVESAMRLLACVRSVDTVARLGGDEFVILLEELVNPSDYLLVANRILKNLAMPSSLEGHKVFVSVSMGIVLNHARYERSDDIMRDADIAMYSAKKHGRNRFEVFDPIMLIGVMTRLELETDLRKALENQEFIVHYQPILDMENHQIVSFEALVRWQHPTRGLTQPADFIPTAEEIGLIVPIGYWVLDEACRQIRDWQIQFPADPPLTINVNLSTRQCAQTDLVQKIVNILKKNNLDPGSLKLELTESLIMEDSAATSAILSELREKGIQVQIDDFGTGYSSLGHLHKLPIDTLKIDRTFISQLGNGGNGLEIVRTILALAHGLGMKVIAEGVETDDQLSKLQSLNCEYVQGFLFAKPVNSLEASILLGKPSLGKGI
jgi:diguanylate cyclase (GGDEF)-like protein